MRCKKPPPGWMCSRKEGHSGPCAASPVPKIEPKMTQVSVLAATETALDIHVAPPADYHFDIRNLAVVFLQMLNAVAVIGKALKAVVDNEEGRLPNAEAEAILNEAKAKLDEMHGLNVG